MVYHIISPLQNPVTPYEIGAILGMFHSLVDTFSKHSLNSMKFSEKNCQLLLRQYETCLNDY